RGLDRLEIVGSAEARLDLLQRYSCLIVIGLHRHGHVVASRESHDGELRSRRSRIDQVAGGLPATREDISVTHAVRGVDQDDATLGTGRWCRTVRPREIGPGECKSQEEERRATKQ